MNQEPRELYDRRQIHLILHYGPRDLTDRNYLTEHVNRNYLRILAEWDTETEGLRLGQSWATWFLNAYRNWVIRDAEYGFYNLFRLKGFPPFNAQGGESITHMVDLNDDLAPRSQDLFEKAVLNYVRDRNMGETANSYFVVITCWLDKWWDEKEPILRTLDRILPVTDVDLNDFPTWSCCAPRTHRIPQDMTQVRTYFIRDHYRRIPAQRLADILISYVLDQNSKYWFTRAKLNELLANHEMLSILFSQGARVSGGQYEGIVEYRHWIGEFNDEDLTETQIERWRDYALEMAYVIIDQWIKQSSSCSTCGGKVPI